MSLLSSLSRLLASEVALFPPTYFRSYRFTLIDRAESHTSRVSPQENPTRPDLHDHIHHSGDVSIADVLIVEPRRLQRERETFDDPFFPSPESICLQQRKDSRPFILLSSR